MATSTTASPVKRARVETSELDAVLSRIKRNSYRSSAREERQFILSLISDLTFRKTR